MKIKTALSENARAQVLATIDAGASRALESYRTSSQFAVAVYALKRAELLAYDAGAKPKESLPILQAEAEALDKSPSEVIGIWRQKIAEEDAIVPRLEARRQELRALAKAARTATELEQVAAAISWP